MKTELNLQDTFLNVARQERQHLTVILVNGFQMRGVLKGFDNFVLILETDGRQQMIYKHAVSTIIPQRNVGLFTQKGDKQKAEESAASIL